MFRGNIVMKGYLKNRAATEEAFAGGWFHSGDLGVMHPDGYIQLKDRSKDIIISGGENISSIEVEEALYKHPAVAFCGVVARADEKWGETPIAFVELKPGRSATRGRAARPLPVVARPLQVAQGGGVHRNPEDLDRQDPEIPPSRARQKRSVNPRDPREPYECRAPSAGSCPPDPDVRERQSCAMNAGSPEWQGRVMRRAKRAVLVEPAIALSHSRK